MAVRSTQGPIRAVPSTQGPNRAVPSTQGPNRWVPSTQGPNRAVPSTYNRNTTGVRTPYVNNACKYCLCTLTWELHISLTTYTTYDTRNCLPLDVARDLVLTPCEIVNVTSSCLALISIFHVFLVWMGKSIPRA